MRRTAVLFLFCLLISRWGRAQQPLVPANPPTPPGYKYQYRVIAQTGGPITTQEGVKTIQAISQYALGQNGEVAFIAQMNAPPTDSGQLALFKSDGTLVAETGKPFNGRLIREFQDVLGFGTGGTLFFVAKSADSEHPNDQPVVTFFGTDGTAYIPKGNTIAGCQLLSDPTRWAFSPSKEDFVFDSSSYPTGPPRNCGSLEILTRNDLIAGQRMMEGTALITRDLIYEDKVYYLGMVGNPSHGYIFTGSEQLLKLPGDTLDLHFSISATGDVVLARPDGIYKFSNQKGTLAPGSQMVSVGTVVGGYRLLNVASPIQTRDNLFYWVRFDYQGTTRRTGNLHGGVAIFDQNGPVFPVLHETMAPWNLSIGLTPSPFYANEVGQMLIQLTIGLRNVLLLATPSSRVETAACPKAPVPGDLVVYWSEGSKPRSPGSFVHVAEVADNGIRVDNRGCATITEVISKWGSWGLYTHAPGNSLYGDNWTVMHPKSRAGNFLKLGHGPEGAELDTDKGHRVQVTSQELCPFWGIIKAPCNDMTPDEAACAVECKCPGLSDEIQPYSYKDPYHTPPLNFDDFHTWQKYECKGWVLARRWGFLRVSNLTPSGGDQALEILDDNEYIDVPYTHGVGYSCKVKPPEKCLSICDALRKAGR